MIIWLLLPMLVACGGAVKRGAVASEQQTRQEPVLYTYEVVRSFPHSTDDYTQGLEFSDGVLWEGTGLFGRSRLQKVDVQSGKTDVVASLPRDEFGEGITVLDGKVYQLTWMSGKCYVYDERSGKLLRTFNYPGEGWGLANNGTELYMSDGTSVIRVLDPETFRQKRSFEVTYLGRPMDFLNELEWVNGRLWANVYTTDQIVIIDPQSGTVEGIVDLSGLLPKTETSATTDVLNGIAVNAAGEIFVTGKNWPKLYQIKIKEL